MSVKSKLTLSISLIMFIFLAITVILNDYSMRVNLREESEADMVRFSKQISGAINQHYLVKTEYGAGSSGAESVINEIVGSNPELVEIAVIDASPFTAGGRSAMREGRPTGKKAGFLTVLYGDYTLSDGDNDVRDVGKAAQGDSVFRRISLRGEAYTLGYIGFRYDTGTYDDTPYVVRTVLSRDYLNARINEQRANAILLAGTLLIFVIFTSYLLSGFLIRPVKSILDKVNEVADGRFDTALEARGKDELGQLAARINTMSKNLDVYTTKLKNAFEENRSMKEYLESIINNTTDAIHVEATNGTIVQVNQAFERMFGWDAEEAVGRKLDLVPERCREEERQAYKELASGTMLTARETVRLRKDGSSIDVSVTTSPIRDKKGVIRAYASITRDITTRNKMDELLRRAEKLNTVGQLAAGVAHEIRNPLTTLRGFLQLQLQTGKHNLGHTELMLSELDRINLIVSEFLILAKPQATKFETKDIRNILGDVMSLLDSQAHLCNIIFVTRFESEPYKIDCEENQLKQVFINVLKNAIEAMPSGGEIEILVKKPALHTISVAIVDHGVGIPEDMIPKLGDPFFTGKETGTGLGIMVSQRIIQSHQGAMDIQSQVGVGTIVTITLPASAE